ncbi:hypothetical protein BY458DRAFT_534655 [Sporodiniella umbellata]|nr:hypothetical protein BY458DRAFT_534655 [Sporodiniella umbellata]
MCSSEGDFFNGYQNFINSTLVEDLIQKVKPAEQQRTLIDLPDTATVEEALDLLLAQDIRSIPIYQLNDTKKYIKIVSALDLLRLLCTQVKEQNMHEDVLNLTLKEANSSNESLNIIRSTDTIKKLIQLFTTEHRVLVKQQESYILLSQTDLIYYFQSENHRLGSKILDLSVSDIKKPGILSTGNYKTSAIEAFLKLGGDSRLSALPIIDDFGEFISELSASDLRGLNRERWSSLKKPVIMYLKESHGELMSPKTCHDQFTLSQVLSAFALRKANRLWWVNSQNQLQGVITLTDIICTFFSNL